MPDSPYHSAKLTFIASVEQTNDGKMKPFFLSGSIVGTQFCSKHKWCESWIPKQNYYGAIY